MEWLNYHHLLYFWVVAREGGLTQASKVLRLAPPTLSAQVHALEERLGEKLFARVGRGLVLTDVGRVVYGYADEIFGLGRELLDAVKHQGVGKPLKLFVGVTDAVPKLLVRRLLEPALSSKEPLHLVCTEGSHESLLADLSRHALDLVIADAPVPAGSSVRAFNHLLGESSVSFFAVPRIAKRLKRGFPRSLNGARALLPISGSPMRRALDHYLSSVDVRLDIAAELQDSALLEAFGVEGIGVFPASTALRADVERQYGVVSIGTVESVRERFYAISIDRRLKHPAVLALTKAARHELFRE